MKAFLLSLVGLVVMSVGAWYGLNEWGWSSAETFSTENVRLSD